MTTIRHQPIERHETHTRRLIGQARGELEKGDRIQTSEKAWGSVAHALEPIDDRRGWKCETRADAHTVARNLAIEQANPRIRELFSIANGLHKNFCVDSKPLDFLGDEIGDAEDLLAILWPLMDDA